MLNSLIKTMLPQVKNYLGKVDEIIVEKLNSISCKREEGEYPAYTIYISKSGESYIVICVYSKDDKLISSGKKIKVTDFLTQIIEAYGSK